MKKLLKLVVVLVLLVVLAGVAGLIFLDQGVETAVERAGTYAMGVETELGGADIELLDGQLGLDSLSIANPAGFKAASFLTLAEGNLEVELDSLMSDTVVVPRLLLSGITLDLERNDSGTNFGAILENLERFESGEKQPAPEEPPAEGGKKVLLKEVVIRDVTVTVDIGKEIVGFQNTSFTLPELVITDLGTGGEGKPVSQHFSDILQRLLDEVLKKGAGQIPPELMAELEGKLELIEGLPDQLTGEVQEKLDQAAEEAKKKLEEVLPGAGEGGGGIEEQTKQLEEGAKKKLGDGLGELWKKQDKGGDGR